MTAREFLSNAAAIVAFMSLLSLVEVAAPLFARGERSEGRRVANFGLTVLTFLLNWAMISAAASFAGVLSLQGRGLLPPLALPTPALIAISVVTLDFSTYLAHRSMHETSLLWRVHRIHHSDPFLDVSTTFRQHPFEGLWRFLWVIIPVCVLGLPIAGLFVYRLLSALQAVCEHANVRLWQPLDQGLSLVWCTPNMHKVHHSRAQPQTDSNYGNILTVFDRVFRTFTPTAEAFDVIYGLEDVERSYERSLSGLVTLPFARF